MSAKRDEEGNWVSWKISKDSRVSLCVLHWAAWGININGKVVCRLITYLPCIAIALLESATKSRVELYVNGQILLQVSAVRLQGHGQDNLRMAMHIKVVFPLNIDSTNHYALSWIASLQQACQLIWMFKPTIKPFTTRDNCLRPLSIFW